MRFEARRYPGKQSNYVTRAAQRTELCFLSHPSLILSNNNTEIFAVLRVTVRSVFIDYEFDWSSLLTARFK